MRKLHWSSNLKARQIPGTGSISPAAHSMHNSVNHGTKWLNIKAHKKVACMLARLLHRGNKVRNKETFTKAWFLLVLVLLCQIIFNFFLIWSEYRVGNHTNREDSSSVCTASQLQELRCKPSGMLEPGTAPCCTTLKLRKKKNNPELTWRVHPLTLQSSTAGTGGGRCASGGHQTKGLCREVPVSSQTQLCSCC